MYEITTCIYWIRTNIVQCLLTPSLKWPPSRRLCLWVFMYCQDMNEPASFSEGSINGCNDNEINFPLYKPCTCLISDHKAPCPPRTCAFILACIFLHGLGFYLYKVATHRRRPTVFFVALTPMVNENAPLPLCLTWKIRGRIRKKRSVGSGVATLKVAKKKMRTFCELNTRTRWPAKIYNILYDTNERR